MSGNHSVLGVGIITVPPSPAISGTSLQTQSGEADRFPVVPFLATMSPPNVISTPDNSEVVNVTDVTGEVFTIVRAQEGTTAKSVLSNWIIYNGIYPTDFSDLEGGVDDKTYEVTLSGETSLTVSHNLGKYPAISVFDSAGDEVEGEYKHLNINTALLTFSSGFSGKAIFN